MKFTLITSFIALLVPVIMAEDPSAVLSSIYSNPPTVTGSQLTSLASALNAIATSWEDSPIYTSVAFAIVAAAPTSVQASLATSGWVWESLTAQPWWTNVPDSAKSAVSSEQAAIDSAYIKVLGTPTTTSKAGASGAKPTGARFIAEVVGVIAAVGGVALL